MPAFWLFVVALFLGGLYGLLLQLAALLVSPAGLALSWILLILYIIPVALVVRWIDLYEREPRSLVIGAFLWGALVGPLFAGFGNDLWGLVITRLGGAEFASNWSAALTAPPIEEIYKWLGVVLIYLIARLEIDDLADGFVYGAIVGLGFAVVEDIFYFIFVFGGDVSSVIEGFLVRVVGSGLYGHVTFTGISGIGLAYFVTRAGHASLAKRIAVAAGLLLLAMFAHFVWNSPLFDDLPLLLYGAVKGLPFLIGLIVLVILARRREKVALGEVLAGEIGRGGVTATELDLLRDRRRRKAAHQTLRRNAGGQAEHLFARLQREQLNLALTASSVDSPDDARLHQQRLIARGLRAALLTAPGASALLDMPADSAPTELQATTFLPDHTVAPLGAWAWQTPDQNGKRMALAIGLPLQVVETRASWLLVRSQSGWHGWTGAPYLDELAQG